MADTTTIGKVLFNRALPKKYRDESRSLDKDSLTALLSDIAKEDPDEYINVLQKVSDVSRMVVSDYGRTASLSLKDFQLPPMLKALKVKYREDVAKIANDPKMTPEQKSQQIVKQLTPEIKRVQDYLMKTEDGKNSFVDQVRIGARGNTAQLMQLLFGDMLVLDHNNKPIPIPGLHSYGEGVTPMEYWAAAYGSRKGYFDVQFATADSGYYSKQLTQAAHRVVVSEDDCGATDVGIEVDGDDSDNVGSIMVSNTVPGVPAGTEIQKKDLAKLSGKRINVRSTTTCQAKEGICSKCAGRRENGEFPSIGDAVGVTAARAIAEPTTQSGLASKHSGGVVGQDDKAVTGFKEINQFVQVPKNFVGSATLASVDGAISKIEKAPQGGSYVYINGEEHYVPGERKLDVKVGQRMEAGDTLSSGVPNPGEVVKYKGIGEGRRYFVEKYNEILKDNGAGNHRRNVEAVARGFINRVKVTDPEGFNGHFINDVLSYDDVVRDYAPRYGAKLTNPKQAVGQYLEKPILHYSIGTRITPNIAKRLSSAKTSNILVHKAQPQFEPFVSRIMDVTSTDKDWMTRLSGFNLKKSFLDAAQRGSTSEIGGTSFVPSVASGQELYEGLKK